jgi:hypothetical protein
MSCYRTETESGSSFAYVSQSEDFAVKMGEVGRLFRRLLWRVLRPIGNSLFGFR